MGYYEEEEREENTAPAPTPRLQLFSLPSLRARDYPESGTLTPPLETQASVPFLWEFEPGKPKPCTTLALALPNPTTKSLDLPPRLLNDSKFSKTPSPTTVLEGPYYTSIGRSILESSSFRFLRKRQGSFDGAPSLNGSGHSSPDKGLLGPTILTSSRSCRREKGRLFGSWKRRGTISFRGYTPSKSEVHGGSLSFSDDGDGDGNGNGNGDGGTVAKMSRKRSLLRISSPSSKSQFWASIYGAFKQIIPRRNNKWKKKVAL